MLVLTHVEINSPFHSSPSLEAGRCWIFPANRDLSVNTAEMMSVLDPFLSQWSAHGAAVEAQSALLCGHFLVIAEGRAGESSSGCSQDALRGCIARLEAMLATPLMAGGRVFWLDAQGTLNVTDRAGFKAAIQAGQVSAETKVFDTLIQNVADLRLGVFLKPAMQSWHKSLFPETVLPVV